MTLVGITPNGPESWRHQTGTPARYCLDLAADGLPRTRSPRLFGAGSPTTSPPRRPGSGVRRRADSGEENMSDLNTPHRGSPSPSKAPAHRDGCPRPSPVSREQTQANPCRPQPGLPPRDRTRQTRRRRDQRQTDRHRGPPASACAPWSRSSPTASSHLEPCLAGHHAAAGVQWAGLPTNTPSNDLHQHRTTRCDVGSAFVSITGPVVGRSRSVAPHPPVAPAVDRSRAASGDDHGS